MKKWYNCNIFFKAVWAVIAVSLIGCTSPVDKLVQLATEAENKEDYFKAVELYELAVQKLDEESKDSRPYLQATDRLAEIYTYHLGNPISGLYWLKQRRAHLVDTVSLVQNQKKMIRLHMDFLNDYNQAVVEAQSLLGYELNIEDRCQINLDLGLALFQLNRQDEAMRETSSCLGNIPISKPLAFKLSNLEIDILMAQKKHQDAIYRIELIKDTFQELDVDQSLQLTQALAYEELGDFGSAFRVLNALMLNSKYSDKGYIKLRLERLKHRESQQAGARLKKRK